MKNKQELADLREMQATMKSIQYQISESSLPLETKVRLQEKANTVAFELLTAIQFFTPETSQL